MKIRIPSGPIRPVLEGLDQIEILQGFVASMEDSAAYQRKKLEEEGWEIIEDQGRIYHTVHGLDGDSWHLDSLISEAFPALQRAATFLVTWSAFEHRLDDLCQEAAKALELQIMPSDLRETGVRRARTYLVRAAGLSGAWANDLWQEVARLQSLRNLFAHCDGTLCEDHAKQRDYASSSPHMTVKHDSVTLKAGFMPHVLKVQEQFLRGLQETIEDRFGKWKPVVYE